MDRSLGSGVANTSFDFMLNRRRRWGVGTSLSGDFQRLGSSSSPRLLHLLAGAVDGPSVSSMVVTGTAEEGSAMGEAGRSPAELLRLTGVAGALPAKLLCLRNVRLEAGVSGAQSMLNRRRLLSLPALLRRAVLGVVPHEAPHI